MNKKIISGALSMALCLTALTGCGGKADDVFTEAIEGEITVSAYEAITYKSYLEEAARKFEEKYPGTKVNVDVAGNMPQMRTQESDGTRIGVMRMEDDQQAKDDYIIKVNTELMSGRGADIVALDILPYYKYADNGQLMDLNDYMARDDEFKKSDYAENIIDGAKYKGGQFLFPLDYTFSYFSYDSSLAPDFQAKDKLTFADVINSIKDRSSETGNKIFPLASYTERGANFVSELLSQDYERFIDVASKKVNLNNGDFAKLLEDAKTYADEGYINESRLIDPRAAENGGNFNMGAFMQQQQEKYYVKTNRNLSLLNQFTRNLGTQGNRVMMSMGGGDTSNDEIAGLIANDKGETQFSYTMGLGINNNSKNKRVAWEFLKFLASEETQSSGLARPDSLPVNKNALKQLAAMSITGENMRRIAGAAGIGSFENNESEPANIELTPEQKTALENYLSQLDKFTVQLNKYVVHDEKIDNMIQDEIRHFFAGAKSADEVANALQSRVNLYLNE